MRPLGSRGGSRRPVERGTSDTPGCKGLLPNSEIAPWDQTQPLWSATKILARGRKKASPNTKAVATHASTSDAVYQNYWPPAAAAPALNVKSWVLLSFGPMVTFWSCSPYFSCTAATV